MRAVRPYERPPAAKPMHLKPTAVVFTVFIVATGGTRVHAGAPQDAASAKVEFDAVSIRPQTDPNISTSSRIGPTTGLRAQKKTVKSLISYAFDVRTDRIEGAPDWLDVATFEMLGKTNRRDVTMAMVREMIRNMLADRFHLRYHTEKRPAPVYALTIARRDGKLGRSLQPSSGCEQGKEVVRPNPDGSTSRRICGIRVYGDRFRTSIEAAGVKLSELVWALNGTGGRDVVDKTSLEGLFDFDLRYSPPKPAGTDPDPTEAPEVFTALREQLGLELRSEEGTIEIFVIDDVQHPEPN